jgi:hypothetical protein
MVRIRIGISVAALASVVIAVASVALTPANAQTTNCLLSPQQQQPCTDDAACRSFGATCNTVTMFCACPIVPPTATCLLATGQLIACVTDAECAPFEAVCGASSVCVCPALPDAGSPLDAATRDAFSPPIEDAGVPRAGVVPTPVGGTGQRPITSGCSYVGR